MVHPPRRRSRHQPRLQLLRTLLLKPRAQHHLHGVTCAYCYIFQLQTDPMSVKQVGDYQRQRQQLERHREQRPHSCRPVLPRSLQLDLLQARTHAETKLVEVLLGQGCQW